MEGAGDNEPEIMFIAEAPGPLSSNSGEPFVDAQGKLIKDIIGEIGKNLGRTVTAHYTNLVLCRTPSDRVPSQTEILNCFSRLNGEIAEVKPKCIVTLGATVATALFDCKKLNDVRGKILDYNGVRTVPSFAAGYIFRNPNFMDTLVDDICRALNEHGIDNNEWHTPRTPVFIRTVEECLAMFNDLVTYECVTVDLETTGLDVINDLPVWLGFRTDDTTYIVHNDIFSRVSEAMPIHGIIYNAHDTRMECNWFKQKYNIEFETIDDTLLLYSLIDGRTGGIVDKSLKGLARHYLGAPEWEKGMEKYLQHGLWEFCPEEQLGQYLSYDVETCHAIRNILLEEIKADAVLYPLKKVIRPATPFVHSMTHNGIRVDLDELARCQDLLAVKSDQLTKGLQDMLGNDKFNPRSPKQLALAIFKELGMPDNNNGSTDEETLSQLLMLEEGDSGFIRSMLEYRSMAKFSSTLKSIRDFTRVDGRMHAKFLLEGTVTGRLSSKDTNMQNVPRNDSCPTVVINGVEETIKIRRLFMANKGYELADVDYSQLELRVGAHMSGDAALIEFLNSGGDMHKEMASYILGVPISQITKLQRQFAKSMVFAVMYDADEKSLVFLFKKDFPFITPELSQRAVRMLRGRFPLLYDNALMLKKQALEQKYVKTIYGRKRRFPLITHENKKGILKQATNAPIQGSGSDICLLQARKASQLFPDIIPHLLVHDSFVFSTPNRERVSDVQEVMSQVDFPTEVKFLTEAKVDQRWDP